MAFPRVKPTGWGLNELLKSGEMNQLDIDHAAAVDGRPGGLQVAARPVNLVQTGRWIYTQGTDLRAYALRLEDDVHGAFIAVGSGGAADGPAGAVYMNGGGTARTTLRGAPAVAHEDGVGGIVFDTNAGSTAQLVLDLPRGARLDSITLTVQGSGGDVALPAVLPSAALWKVDTGDGTLDTGSVPFTADPAPTHAVFHGPHQFDVPVVPPVVVDALIRYVLVVTDEAGTNSHPGFHVFAAIANCTVSALDPGAS